MYLATCIEKNWKDSLTEKFVLKRQWIDKLNNIGNCDTLINIGWRWQCNVTFRQMKEQLWTLSNSFDVGFYECCAQKHGETRLTSMATNNQPCPWLEDPTCPTSWNYKAKIECTLEPLSFPPQTLMHNHRKHHELHVSFMFLEKRKRCDGLV